MFYMNLVSLFYFSSISLWRLEWCYNSIGGMSICPFQKYDLIPFGINAYMVCCIRISNMLEFSG